jgi:hypothetical protein
LLFFVPSVFCLLDPYNSSLLFPALFPHRLRPLLTCLFVILGHFGSFSLTFGAWWVLFNDFCALSALPTSTIAFPALSCIHPSPVRSFWENHDFTIFWTLTPPLYHHRGSKNRDCRISSNDTSFGAPFDGDAPGTLRFCIGAVLGRKTGAGKAEPYYTYESSRESKFLDFSDFVQRHPIRRGIRWRCPVPYTAVVACTGTAAASTRCSPPVPVLSYGTVTDAVTVH